MPTPWDAHLAQLIRKVPKGKCAMFGHDGTPWTSSSSFNADEMKCLFAGFANPGSLFASSLQVDGVKFMTTRADDHLIILKHQQDGVIAIKTPKTYVVCHFNESDLTPAQANLAVQAFGDYLGSLGF